MLRNHVFDAFFERNPIYGGKMGVAATVTPRRLVSKDPTKKLVQWVDLLGQPLSRKHVFEIFGPEPSPLINISFFENILNA